VALADYFERHMVAASQVIAGFDRDAFEARVGGTRVGLVWNEDVLDGPSGEAMLDLTVRLLARLYPAVRLVGPVGPTRDRLEELALAINPRIDLSAKGAVHGGIAVGSATSSFERTIYAGADEWLALVDAKSNRPVRTSDNPFGAGGAACLAVGNLFRALFLPDTRLDLDTSVSIDRLVGSQGNRDTTGTLPAATALVGVGAIGNAAIWALARSRMGGRLTLVDHEPLELSNIQRYVMAVRSDEGRSKVDIAERAFSGPTRPDAFAGNLQQFVESVDHRVDAMLLALDSAEDRRAGQASLPRWVANAWTQPNDLGISVHPTFGAGDVCVACLYLPTGTTPNEDAIVSDALGIADQVAEVRTLLHTGGGVSRALLELIAERLPASIDLLTRYEGASIRDLYVKGVCGGGVLPLGSTGTPRTELHVPLAHQSAMAGLLLAAALTCHAGGVGASRATVSHINPLRPVPPEPTQVMRARGDQVCLCEDPDFRSVWRRKYGS
jgi:hypothetical protein